MRRVVVPVVGAALLIGLVPAESLALPPSPVVAEDGRADPYLLPLETDKPLEGEIVNNQLESLKADVPEDQEQAPAGTDVVPPADTGVVTFGSTTSPALARTAATSVPDPTPVDDLPVSLGQAAGQPAPTGTWQVSVAARTSAVAQGVDGTVITVQAPAAGTVPISVQLDYAKFKNLYGADWASRLRLVQFPDCYLTTPDDEACQSYEELETTNDIDDEAITATVDPAVETGATPASTTDNSRSGSGMLQAAYRTSATAAAAGSTAVVGAIDSGAGAGGSFKATPLAADGKWAAGDSSGAFTWSYPLTVPAPPAGPAPNIAFNYTSQSVDGRTAVSSPQASWIGEGWNYEPGHIERRYRSCKDDTKKIGAGEANNTAKKDKASDLCWVSYNAVMSLGGKTTELVRVDEEGKAGLYRPQQDDGTRVELRVDGTNDDNNGEYWVVTTTDGTTYYYGLNKVDGGHANTDSVSTVPVFGNHPEEPCHAATFAESRCGAGKQEAWRWGLDKVVDVNGNTMVINWKQETNYYAPRAKYKSPESYDRNAYPVSIEYGMRSDLTKPSATVEFGTAQRCLRSTTDCTATNFAKTDDPGAYRPWWDTPGNLNCKSTSKLCPSFPSFWTQLRLDSVTTKAARAGQSGLGKVDTYKLNQSFPEDWYDTAPGLWLNSITRRGFAPGDTTGTVQSDAGVSFSPYSVGTTSPLHDRLLDRQLPNLVTDRPGDMRPGFTRPRIGTVSTEYGGDIEVEYAGGCDSVPAEDAGKDNGTCYPVRWSPDGDEKTPAKAWFNKYVVKKVIESDRVGAHRLPVVTAYAYSGPAWAKSEDEFTRPSLRTYSDWRGYRQVSVTKGSELTSSNGVAQPQSYAVTRYFQGTGGALKDSTGTRTLVADDAQQYAGMTAETLTYQDSDKLLLRRTLNYPWSKRTASRPLEHEDGTPSTDELVAFRSGVRQTDTIQYLDRSGSSWRAVRTTTEVDDTYGLPTQIETAVVTPNGTGETLSEQTCTKPTYVHNVKAGLIGLPIQERTTATPCSGFATADPATRLQSSVQTSYDDLPYGAEPTKGRPTTVAAINGTGSAHSVLTKSTYDPLGRVRTLTTPAGTSETVYTPGDVGGPVTETVSYDAKRYKTTTTFDPGRALPLTVTDANGRMTRTEYDALGRLIRGFTPSHAAAGSPADVTISYKSAAATSDKTSPTAVTVNSLEDDGTYSHQVTIYDGLMRQVQTQVEAHGPGRVITDTTYNDHGMVEKQTGGYLAKGEPTSDLFQPKSDSVIQSYTLARYDGLDRQYRLDTYLGGVRKYWADTAYGFSSTRTDPPGTTAPQTESFTDALGRVTSIRHYTKDDRASYRTTTYSYDARGNRDKVTDTSGNNVWSYTFDARGRVTSVTDPDTGTTATEYDDADRPVKVTSARQKATFTEYDELGRVSKVREGSTTANPTEEFAYDSLPGALGKPVSSIRHAASGDYITRVTGYDTEYRPTGRETVVPDNALTKGLSGTYAYAYAYTATGKPLSVTLPAKGGLAAEKVITRYDDDGLPESTSGLSWYTADATYSPYGEVLRTVTGSQPSRVWTTNFVDQRSGRLQRTVTDRETAGPHRIADGYYSYDASGTITSSARQFGDNTWDNQCFTYDVMGELTNAWTSKVVPGGKGTGCTSTSGTVWGYKTTNEFSSGPVADASDAAADTMGSPDASLTASLAATAPASDTVSTGTTAYHQSFTFDYLGNRASLTEHDPADATKNATYTYAYGKSVAGNGTQPPTIAQPHTVTSIASAPAGKSSSYVYDATGNTTDRDLTGSAQDLTWTSENKLDTITAGGTKTSYVYDTDGNRILENSPTGSTLYLGETELTTDASGTITRASRSYGQAGAPTVVRTTSNGATTGHKLNALITDQLGTANTSVELSGTQPVTRRAYKPYGELRGAKPTTWPNKRSYLGVGIDDATTGLTHIGAREYDQDSGRFLSADPIIDIADPLQMNGYAYANNSPISSSDPTGLMNAAMGGGGNATEKEIISVAYQYEVSKGTNPYRAYQIGVSAWNSFKPKKQLSDQIAIFPGLTINKNYPGAKKYAAAIRKDAADRKLFAYEPSDESVGDLGYTLTLALLQVNACDDTGICPGGKAKAFSRYAGAAGSFGISEGAGASGKKGTKSEGGGVCKQCFPAGTRVLLADKSSKDIQDVKPGDRVLATDPETGETAPREVTRLIITEDDKHFNELTIQTQDGSKSLTATYEHPFWVPSLGAWVEARNLTAGTDLRTPDGTTVSVTANRAYSKRARTYNLTVDDLHTYYVLAGETPVLVHNSNCLEGGLAAADDASRAFTKPGKLSGALFLDDYVDDWMPLSSGARNLSPNHVRPSGASTSNFHHLETQAAAEMRRLGAGSGHLFIGNNKQPCGACHSSLSQMLPPGATLNVTYRRPSGGTTTVIYRGNAG
ncbi:polymorphic toxin-type HINT domain-containing protein [Streptomyces sp. NPDC048428]|uniref:polymorphic toxin-type HINT domain-containing protein n=1 Tax=Streptomyces sp. NPDC048428 TaxID=3154503 RepID=UPI003417774C